MGIASKHLGLLTRTWTFGYRPLNGESTVDDGGWKLRRVSDVSEQVAVARLEQRLGSVYARVPPDRISAAVHDARVRFDQSPIRDFVPLLVERRVRAQLAEASNRTAKA